MASISFGLHNQLLRCTEAGKTQAEEQVAPPGAQVRVRQKVTLVPGDRGFGCYPAGLEGLAWPVPAASALPGHVRSTVPFVAYRIWQDTRSSEQPHS
jgi:hypothetical protein